MFSLSGPVAFPIVLGSWMLADTPATNVMASHPAIALAVLEDQPAYWRWLAARCVVIGSLVGLVCIPGVLWVTIGRYPTSAIVWACVLVAVVPVGVLPVAAWLGIVFPYRVRSLRWRWDHRRAWRLHLRWAVLVLAPLVYVPLIGSAIFSPGVQLALHLKRPDQPLTSTQFGTAAAVVCVTAGAAAALGLWVSRRLLAWRTGDLTAYLAHDDRG